MQHILSSPTKSSLEFERATRTVLLDALLKGDDTIAEAVATADEEFKKFKEKQAKSSVYHRIPRNARNLEVASRVMSVVESLQKSIDFREQTVSDSEEQEKKVRDDKKNGDVVPKATCFPAKTTLSTYSNDQEIKSSISNQGEIRLPQETSTPNDEAVSPSQKNRTQTLFCTESKTDCSQQTLDTTLPTKVEHSTKKSEKNEKEETLQLSPGNEITNDPNQKMMETSPPLTSITSSTQRDLTDTSRFGDVKSIDYHLKESEHFNTTEDHSKETNKTRKCPTPPSPTKFHNPIETKQKTSWQPTLLSFWKKDNSSVNPSVQQKSKDTKRKQKTFSNETLNEEIGNSQRKKQKLQ